jgi:hypothetical protein
MELHMGNLTVYVPTYYTRVVDPKLGVRAYQEFDEPRIPIVVGFADDLRIVLGSHNPVDANMPNLKIERWPGGWIILLYPLGGEDPSGHVYFLDSGRSFIVPESPLGSTPPIILRHHETEIPEIDRPKD